MIAAFKTNADKGDYDNITEADAFAETVTKDL
jgi:hypothetical protein